MFNRPIASPPDAWIDVCMREWCAVPSSAGAFRISRRAARASACGRPAHSDNWAPKQRGCSRRRPQADESDSKRCEEGS